MGLFDLFSSSQGVNAAAKAKQAAVDTASKGFKQQKKYLQTGAAQGQTYLDQALPQWQTIFEQGAPGVNTFYGALGVPGYDSGAAQGAWQSSIPYQQFQSGVPDIYEAALRRGGLTGQTGQVPIDLNSRLMSSLNQFYEPWLTGLSQGFGQEAAGATGQTNIYNNKATLAGNEATALANAAANKYNTIGAAKTAYPQNVYAAQSGADTNKLNALFGIAQLGGQALASAFGGPLAGLMSPGAESAANMTGMYQLPDGTWADAYSNPATGTFG